LKSGLNTALILRMFSAKVDSMSAAEIIEQIHQLPDDEREKVKRFTQLNLEPVQLSGQELAALAKRMIEAKHPAEGDRLEKEIIRGFYGDAGPDA
jgi:hypothetical protein